MTIQEYIENIDRRYCAGNATEHTFRGDLQQLLESLVPDISATNEPKRQACGAPDYVITRREIPLGFIEAKDVGVDLKSKTLKEQFDRYRTSLNNLLFTDYLHFRLYVDGEFVTEVKIGEVQDNHIAPLPENFPVFSQLIQNFCVQTGQTIKSSKKLAGMMAGKARMLSMVIEKALNSDVERKENSTLQEQMLAFRQILIHDIQAKEFADIYAQTIAYGMFAARLHDPTLETFSRQEAAERIPKTNPFLRRLFGYIAGPDIDDRIKWIVDALADIFRATDVAALLKNFGKATQMHDPIIHFYETFLAEYDPKLRKARGVWYTPEPVVNFIVRAVDDILITEFELPQGLADISKTTIKVNTQMPDKRSSTGYKQLDQEVHKVQILDPATGTGTFLAEVVKHIHQKFEGQQGLWSNYVENHLVPRLNGFELLMASYAMAHLKLDMLLTETGYRPKKEQRFRVYLTNSLEEHHQDTGTLFANWLSSEANEANHIKRDTPVMCVIGNPPYSVSSTNKGEWIESLTADYKKDLNERNIQPLSDDYIKFIRYGQNYVDKNGEGVLAYISNNSFIDGLIHRQMRKSILESFDKVYVLDLHGSTKKNECALDGTKDTNVFDIQQGVSINIFVKTGNKKKNQLAKVYHSDLLGTREFKNSFLSKNSLRSIKWNDLNFSPPHFFFVPKNFQEKELYEKGFNVSDLFKEFACGVVTARDSILVQQSREEVEVVLRDFKELEESNFRKKYNEHKDSRDWTYSNAKIEADNAIVEKVDYRPFDCRFILYSPKSKGILSYPRNEIMKQVISRDNLSILICKQQSTFDFQHIFISANVTDKCTISTQTKEASYQFPLYLYPNSNGQHNIEEEPERVPNLNEEIVQEFARKLQLTFVPEKETEGEVCFAGSSELKPEFRQSFAPIDLLDYIYAVLHSPAYREKYKEFMKINFPRVPYSEDAVTFWKLVSMGSELRKIHLLESPRVNTFISSYPEDGSNEITRSIGKKDWELYNEKEGIGRIWINEIQYFDKIPLTAWEFYIGGYQPAQKWLKDRKGRELSFNDILHYQKIIVALSETNRLMGEIDKIEL